jgi:hypothetical protein
MKANEDFPRELGVLKQEGEKTVRKVNSKFSVPLALGGRFYGTVFARVI